MAVLALATIGSYIGGTVLGYGAIGAAVGYAAGTLLGQSFEKLPGQEGPRLQDLQATHSIYGAPINRLWGSARINGSIIWAPPLIEVRHDEKSGGKGGSEQTITTYSYYADFAVKICRGEITGISKIWADSILIYNVTSGATVEEIISSSQIAENITIYTGSETQLPDPLIESYKGVDTVPAFRGDTYIVFNKLEVAKFGNRIPNITIEAVSTGAVSSEWENVGSLQAYGGELKALSNGTLLATSGLYRAPSGGGAPTLGKVHLSKDYGVTWQSIAILSTTYRASIIAVDEDSKNKIFVTTDDGKIHVSYDYGLTWETIYTLGSTSNPPRSMIVLNSGALLVGMFSGQLYLSNDNGVSFVNVSPSAATYYEIIKISSYSALASNTQGSVFITLDSGVTWDLVLSVGSNDIRTGIHIGDGIIFMGAVDGRLYRSTDYGYNWTQVTSPTSVNIASFYFYNDTIYLGTSGTFYYSTDQGDTWAADTLNTSPDSHGGVEGIIGHILATITYDAPGKVYVKKGALLSKNKIPLSTIVSDICLDAGLTAGELDVSALTDNVSGYVSTRQMPARSAIEPLRQAYYIDLIESDGKLKAVKRGGSSVYSIISDNLSVRGEGQKQPDLLTITRIQESELPRSLSISYIGKDDDYQQNLQRSSRLITSATNEISIQLPIVFTDDEAAQIAEILNYNAWIERDSFNFTLPLDYIELDPSDVITLTTDNDNYELRLIAIDNHGGILQCSGVINSTEYSSTVVGGESAGISSQVTGLVGSTILRLLDINMLRDQDDSAGFYIAGNGYFSGWSGSVVYSSYDNETYSTLTNILSGAVIGSATSVLGIGSKNRVDVVNTVNIRISSAAGSLSNITKAQLLNGSNAALLGDEVIQFQTATLEADGSYTLSNLLRSRRGTEPGIHIIGDRFILLVENSLIRVDQDNSALDVLRYYKGVSIGGYIQTTDEETFTNTGNCLKPYAPVSVKGSRDGSNNLTITWLRRSRITAKSLWSPVLKENIESYEVDIMNGTTVLRTITGLTTQTASYTAAQQTTDGLTPGDPVTVQVFQLSATVGRGYTREAII